MKILILGASQGTGALAAKAALARGHEVTAFARTPQKLDIEHEKLTRRVGDFHEKASIEAAVRGQDAVIITASPTAFKAFKERPDYFSGGTGYAIEAMKENGVKRLVVLSALGTGESLAVAPFLFKVIGIGWLLKVPFEDHERQEKLVRESGLEWIITRPGRLTDGPARKRYVKKTVIEPVPSSISRADVADFLVEACETDAWSGKAVQLGG